MIEFDFIGTEKDDASYPMHEGKNSTMTMKVEKGGLRGHLKSNRLKFKRY